MKYKKTLICLFVILFGFAGQLISDDLEEFDTFTYGDWTGTAYRLANGSFSHCHIERAYENGIVLAIALTGANEINILLAAESLRLSLDIDYEVNLLIDDKDLGHFDAKANDYSSLQIALGNRADIFEELRLGNRLVVQGEYENLFFGLKGTKKALGMVKECVESASSAVPAE